MCRKTKVGSYDGKVLKEMGKEEGILTVNLEIEKQRQFRKEFPILEEMGRNENE